MRKRNKLGLLLMAVAAAGVFAPSAQADLIIDDFSAAPAFENPAYQFLNIPGQMAVDTSTGGGGVSSVWQDGSIFGTYRKLYVSLGAGGTRVSLGVDGGAAFESQDPSSAPAFIAPTVAHITWDATNVANTVNLGGASSLNGFAQFYIETDKLNANRSLSIQLWETGNAVAQTVQFTVLANQDKHYINLASFANLNLVSDTISALRLNFLTDDLTVNMFSLLERPGGPEAPVVPVPAAAGLGLLGMGLIGVMRRRKHAQA